MEQLRERALAAIDEAATKSHKGPVERTLALRFALAFLGNFSEERWPFDEFWKALQEPRDKERWASIIGARNGIYRVVGCKPQRNV
jgi:hypothetical protein